MALIDKASLLMVPSVYEDGTLYNVLPSGNKAPDETGNHNGYDQTRADFTFSRGFNLTATRVNADGLIEKGRENLVTYSNDFTNASWSKNSIQSVTGGHSGYDGSNDAGLIVPNTTASAHQISKNTETFTGLQTYSIYAKNGGYDLQLRATGIGSTNIWVSFDLTNGVVGTSGGGQIDSSITSIGNGWYRCSMTFNTASPPYIGLYQVPNGATSGQAEVFEGDGTSGLYVQDAQVERSLVPTDYIETGSTTATAGVLENTPRIDYSSGAGALLLEPQRTNLVPESEWFGTYSSNANGTGSLPLIYTNNAISPDGDKNATKIVFDAGSGTTTGDESQISKNIGGLTIGADYTLSFYAKGENGGEEIVSRAVSGGYTKFTLTTEWKRYELTQSAAATSYAIWFGIRQGLGGIGTINSSATIYLWGVQEEAASYPSSYVPTYGSAATRGADACSVTGVSDVIGQTEGTLFFECTNKALVNQARYFLLSDGTFNNRIDIYQYSATQLGVYVATSGVGQVAGQYVTLPSSGSFKFAVAYANNDYIWYLNGSQIGTDTTGSVPTLTNALFALNADGGTSGSAGNSPFKQAILFKERLSNAELAALTA